MVIETSSHFNHANLCRSIYSGKIGSASFSLQSFLMHVFFALTLACLMPSASLSISHVAQQYINQGELIKSLLQINDHDEVFQILNRNKSFVNKSLWDILIIKGDFEFASKGLQESIHVYKIAAEVAKFLNNDQYLAYTYYYIGAAQTEKLKYKEAIQSYIASKDLLQKANLQRDLIYILAGLGSLHYFIEDYKKAKSYSQECIDLAGKLKSSDYPVGLWPDNQGVADAFSTLGGISRRSGDYDRALTQLNQALMMYRELANGSIKYKHPIIDVLADLGITHNEAGNNHEAIKFLHEALELSKEMLFIDRRARVLNNLGVLYLEQEDYEKAKYFLEQNLTIATQKRNYLEISRALLNLGVIEFRCQNYDTAIELLNRSLELATANSLKAVIIASNSTLSAIYKAKFDFYKALGLLDIGLFFAKEIEDKNRISIILWRQADVRYEMGEYAISATLAEESLRLAREMRFFNLSYYSATILGKAQLAQGQTNQAFKTLTQAIEWVEEARHRIVGQEDEKVYFFENKLEPYHILMKMMVDQNKPLEALRYAEKAKARSLLDAMQRGRVDIKKAMTEKERQEEQRLNQDIVRLNTQLRAEQSKQSPDAKKIEQLKEELYSARLKYAIFEDTIPASRPEAKPESWQSAPEPGIALNNLAGIATASHTAFVQYAVTKDRLYLFVFARDGRGMNLSVQTVPIKNDVLAEQVNRFHQMVSTRNANFIGLSRDLYSWLIKPIEPQLRSKRALCIIPDGVLWNIPFQALLSEAGRYLVEDRAIYYAPSFSTLAEMSAGKAPDGGRATGGLLAFGNPVIEQEQLAALRQWQSSPIFESLPETEKEVQALSRLFPPTRRKVLLGSEAREDVFKALTSNAGTIHFATHGVLDNRQPLYSFLLFSRDSNDPENDGLLEAREIMNLKLNARMAVLSACETARGRIGAGEGVVGISWAFFIAGCPTTVVSQWKVDSAAATNLMIPFYRFLNSQNPKVAVSKAGALRQAMIGLMRDARYRHPYYWAGFVVMGSDR